MKNLCWQRLAEVLEKVCAMYLLAAVLFLVLGIFCIATPETIWQLQHMFTVRDGEPTDFALISIRVSGVLFLLLSAAIVLSILFGVL